MRSEEDWQELIPTVLFPSLNGREQLGGGQAGQQLGKPAGAGYLEFVTREGRGPWKRLNVDSRQNGR